MKLNKNKNSKFLRTASLSQVFLLVFSVVAFGYAVGSEVGEVSGEIPNGAQYWDKRVVQNSQKQNVDAFFYHVKQDGSWKEAQVSKFGETTPKLQSGLQNSNFQKSTDDFYNSLQQVGTGKDVNIRLAEGGNIRQFYTGDKTINVGQGGKLEEVVDSSIGGFGSSEEVPFAEATKTPTITPEPAGGNAQTEDAGLLQGSGTSPVVPPPAGSGAPPPAIVPPKAFDLNPYVGQENIEIHYVGGGSAVGTLIQDPKTKEYALKTASGEVKPINPNEVADVSGAMSMSLFFQNLLWATAIYGGIQLFGPMLGLGKEQVQPLANAATIGFLVGKTLSDVSITLRTSQFWGVSAAGWIGIGIGVAYLLHEYKQEDTKSVQFTCVPWQPPKGGSNCDLCNSQQNGLPCSEYQCRSLGQACVLVNKGTSEEKCVWQNRNDVNPPVVTPLTSALLSDDYEYIPNNAILPPDRGVKINYKNSASGDGCVPAFTPLRFGITTWNSNGENSEPAKCKVDSARQDSFDNMTLFMDDGLIEYNHTFSLGLPGPQNAKAEGIEVQNGGEFSLYVRCEDANGNANIGNLVFNYCVEKGADTTPALIVSTSMPNNMPFAFNQTEIPIEVYTNEPVECRWSHNNRDYETMDGIMDCSKADSITDANAQGLYTCGATLTGLKDRVNNQFYFKCQDQPGADANSRNTNKDSHILTLRGTESLIITSALPDNDTIKDSTEAVKVTLNVKTSAGQSKGQAICYYSATGNDNDYVEFFSTNSFQHSQDLYLTQGAYFYYLKCVDLGGNTDNRTIYFNVESDHQSPIVARAYHEDTYMKIVTDEPAECVYDVVDCTYQFDAGIKMTDVNDVNHFTKWTPNSNLYIKCRDKYQNQPAPNACSITVKAFDV